MDVGVATIIAAVIGGSAIVAAGSSGRRRHPNATSPTASGSWRQAQRWLVLVGVIGCLAILALRAAPEPSMKDDDASMERSTSIRAEYPYSRHRRSFSQGEGSQPYRGEVPLPMAATHNRWRTSLMGDLVRAVRSLWTDSPPIEAFHGAETRHPEWAPAMEALVRARFGASAVARASLPGLQIESIDCRSSSCRLLISYPRELENGGRGVLQRFVRASGRLAATTMILGERRDDVSDWRSLDVLIVFSPEEIDPNRYKTRMSQASR
jgi:hypothetical protein